MKNKVSLEDIAKECGVTKGLVSRALAGKYNVSEQMHDKICRKAVEMGYDFSRLRTRKGPSSRVLIACPSHLLFKEDFWQPIIQSIISTLNKHNLVGEYFIFEEDTLSSAQLKKLANEIYGAYIVIHIDPEPLMNVLLSSSRPIILVDPKTFFSDATQVKFSNYDSIYAATTSLIKQGHKHIAFYGADAHSTSFRERHEGFLASIDAHREEGIKDYNIIFDNSNTNYADEKMFSEAFANNQITALICANDIIAINAYASLRKLGKHVPDDVSVIGFDDVRSAETCSPGLTTFHVPRKEVGREIAKYAVNSIRNEQAPYSQIVIRCRYVKRNSTREISEGDN